jgi:uncharacterized membrane protein
MAGILTSLQRTIVTGFILTALLFALLINLDGHNLALKDIGSWSFFFRWLHVISGVMWIGILWYFNFVQIPNMGNIPDDQKPAISKVIAPAALWWFRWGAMATIITGLVLAHLNGYLGQALSLGYVDEFNVGKNIAIGIGMWLGIIMFINVWFIIWPNQKIALGIVDGSADEKAAAGRKAMLFSRTNTMLSIPMLFAMVSAQNIYGS